MLNSIALPYVDNNQPELRDRFFDFIEQIKNCDYPKTDSFENELYQKFLHNEIDKLRFQIWSPYEMYAPKLVSSKYYKRRTFKPDMKTSRSFFLKHYRKLSNQFDELKPLILKSYDETFKTADFQHNLLLLSFIAECIVEIFKTLDDQKI